MGFTARAGSNPVSDTPLAAQTRRPPNPPIEVRGPICKILQERASQLPTDEEFRARARQIVDETGKDQRAAVRQIDGFGDEMGEKLERSIDELDKAVGMEDKGDSPPPPPPA